MKIKGLQKRVIGTPFPKGVSGNPKGRPPDNAELKAIKELDRYELTSTFSDLFRKDLPEIEDILRNKHNPVRVLGMAKSIRNWLKGGDFRYVQPYFAYIYGLPKAVHEVTGKNGTAIVPPSVDLSKIPSDVLQKLVDRGES